MATVGGTAGGPASSRAAASPRGGTGRSGVPLGCGSPGRGGRQLPASRSGAPVVGSAVADPPEPTSVGRPWGQTLSPADPGRRPGAAPAVVDAAWACPSAAAPWRRSGAVAVAPGDPAAAAAAKPAAVDAASGGEPEAVPGAGRGPGAAALRGRRNARSSGSDGPPNPPTSWVPGTRGVAPGHGLAVRVSPDHVEGIAFGVVCSTADFPASPAGSSAGASDVPSPPMCSPAAASVPSARSSTTGNAAVESAPGSSSTRPASPRGLAKTSPLAVRPAASWPAVTSAAAAGLVAGAYPATVASPGTACLAAAGSARASPAAA